jgi:hypothetical protein
MPRPRLHKSSIIVGLIVALLLVLVNIPGRVVGGMGGEFASKVFEHGWPRVYLRREAGKRPTAEFYTSPEGQQLALSYSPVIYPLNVRSDLPRWGIPWLSVENWRFWEADTMAVPPRRVFSRVNQLWNIAVSLLLLSGVVAVWQFWRRRRATLLSFRFGLRGLLLAIAAVGAALGWLTYVQREHWRETALIEQVFESTGPMEGTWFNTDQVCVAPRWLSLLIGVQPFPEYFWRASAVQIQPEYGYNAEFFCSQISRLKYVRKVAVDGHSRIRFPFSALRSLEQLETLEIWTYPVINRQDVNELAQLKQLQKIVVEDLDEIDPEALARLKSALTNCTIIDSSDEW